MNYPPLNRLRQFEVWVVHNPYCHSEYGEDLVDCTEKHVNDVIQKRKEEGWFYDFVEN